MNIGDFLAQPAVLESILEKSPKPKWTPTVDPTTKNGIFNRKALDLLAQSTHRKPFPAQIEYAILPQFANLSERNVGILLGEMGVGKTTISNAIAYLLSKTDEQMVKRGGKVLFLTSGAKHIKKMAREVRLFLGNGADIYVISTHPRKKSELKEVTAEFAANFKPTKGKLAYFLLSKDTGKTSYKRVSLKGVDKCPDCGKVLIPAKRGLREYKRQEGVRSCPHCKSQTWQAIRERDPKTGLLKRLKSGELSKVSLSIGEKFKKIAGPRTRKLFDFFIVDEAHEMQSADSAQAMLYKKIIRVSRKTLIMTGTLTNGMASSMFHILYPLIPEHFKKYGFSYDNIGMFVDFFGSRRIRKTVFANDSGTSKSSVKMLEDPKINERIVSFLADYTTWLSIADLCVDMPGYEEHEVICDIDPIVKDNFDDYVRRLKAEVAARRGIGRDNDDREYFVKEGAKLLFAQKQSLFWALNNPTHEYTQVLSTDTYINDDGEVEEVVGKVSSVPLPSSFRTTKDIALLNIVREEVAQDRRVIVYTSYNNANKIGDRLVEVLGDLSDEGIVVNRLPDSTKSEEIEDWIFKQTGQVVILPQKRVSTGFDFVMYHTIIFYETDRMLRTVQQAKVRPWRPIGQEKDVKVYFLGYRGAQEKSLSDMGKKTRGSAVVEGMAIKPGSIAALHDYNPEMTKQILKITEDLNGDDVSCSFLRKKSESEIEKYFEERLAYYRGERDKPQILLAGPVKLLLLENKLAKSSVVSVKKDSIAAVATIIKSAKAKDEANVTLNNKTLEEIRKEKALRKKLQKEKMVAEAKSEKSEKTLSGQTTIWDFM